MPARVADASVIGAAAFGEPNADQAASLIEGAVLFEPSLLNYELSSIARKKARLYPQEVAAIFRALDTALAMGVRWVEVDHAVVPRLALETGLTTYDACYLYVARTLGIPLVTFDRQLIRVSHQSL